MTPETQHAARSSRRLPPGDGRRHRFPDALAELVDEAAQSPNRATIFTVEEIETTWQVGYDCGVEDTHVGREWLLVAYLVCLLSGALVGFVAGAIVL